MSEAPGVDVVHFNATKALDVITRVVTDDEPCFHLAELNLPSRSGKSLSRFQLLRIVRNDRLETAYVYLGPASRFRADQFTMLGGYVDDSGRGQVWHTVAELRDGAEELRNRPPRRELEPLDLQGAFREFSEEKNHRVNHQSTFGLGGSVVRP